MKNAEMQEVDLSNVRHDSICIVGHHKLFRQALRTLLRNTDFDVRYEANDIDEVCTALTNDHADFDSMDLVLLDLAIDGENFLDELQDIRTRLPHAPVVILNDSINMRILEACLAGGAAGYLVKDISLEALLHSLRLVMLGEKIFPTNLAELLLTDKFHLPLHDFSVGKVHGLSEREGQILHCLVDGDSNKQIALRLNITESTVKVHMKSLLRKIKVENRTQAAIWALKYEHAAVQ